MTERETVEVDSDYLWALEVVACDSLSIDGETADDLPKRYQTARRTIENANLNRPTGLGDSDQ